MGFILRTAVLAVVLFGITLLLGIFFPPEALFSERLVWSIGLAGAWFALVRVTDSKRNGLGRLFYLIVTLAFLAPVAIIAIQTYPILDGVEQWLLNAGIVLPQIQFTQQEFIDAVAEFLRDEVTFTVGFVLAIIVLAWSILSLHKVSDQMEKRRHIEKVEKLEGQIASDNKAKSSLSAQVANLRGGNLRGGMAPKLDSASIGRVVRIIPGSNSDMSDYFILTNTEGESWRLFVRYGSSYEKEGSAPKDLVEETIARFIEAFASVAVQIPQAESNGTPQVEREHPFEIWPGETPKGTFLFVTVRDHEEFPWYKAVGDRFVRVSDAEIDYVKAWKEIKDSGNDSSVIADNISRLTWNGSHDEADPGMDQKTPAPVEEPGSTPVRSYHVLPADFAAYSRTYEPGYEAEDYTDTLFSERTGETDRGEFHFFGPHDGTVWLKLVAAKRIVQVSEAELAYIEAYYRLNDENDEFDELTVAETKEFVKTLDAWNGSHDEADDQAIQMISLQDANLMAQAAAEEARRDEAKKHQVQLREMTEVEAYEADLANPVPPIGRASVDGEEDSSTGEDPNAGDPVADGPAPETSGWGTPEPTPSHGDEPAEADPESRG